MTKQTSTIARRQKFDFRTEPKITTSSYMLLDHCYAIGLSLQPSGLKKKFLKGRDPMTSFCPALDPPLGGSGKKTTTLVRDHEHFIPTKFHQNQASGSGEEIDNVKDYGRTTHGAL